MTPTTITKRATDALSYANGETAFFILGGKYLSSATQNSSAVRFWSYDLRSGELTVQYMKSDTFYRYEAVPFSAIFDLMLADSLGAFIAKEIKPNYSVA